MRLDTVIPGQLPEQCSTLSREKTRFVSERPKAALQRRSRNEKTHFVYSQDMTFDESNRQPGQTGRIVCHNAVEIETDNYFFARRCHVLHHTPKYVRVTEMELWVKNEKAPGSILHGRLTACPTINPPCKIQIPVQFSLS